MPARIFAPGTVPSYSNYGLTLAGYIVQRVSGEPFDKYIAAPDASYKYELVNKVPGKGYTTYILNMTSQTWRAQSEVDRNVWRHWMIMVKPDQVNSSKSLLYISGGNNNSAAPKEADPPVVQVAMATNSVVTELRMVPNQPLTFSDDKKPRVEDEMIAYRIDRSDPETKTNCAVGRAPAAL